MLPWGRGAIAGRLERLPASRAGGVHRLMRWNGQADGLIERRPSFVATIQKFRDPLLGTCGDKKVHCDTQAYLCSLWGMH